MGSSGAQAAIAAGYSAKAAKETAWRLLHRDNAVMAAVREAQGELRQKTEVTAESMMRQLAEDRALAIEAQQHSAAVKASELQAKLAGLLIDRVDARAQHQIRVEVVRFADVQGGTP